MFVCLQTQDIICALVQITGADHECDKDQNISTVRGGRYWVLRHVSLIDASITWHREIVPC